MSPIRPNSARLRWQASSRSQNTNCVEIASLGRGNTAPVGMRDSKNRGGPVLVFARERWWDFVASTKDGEFDRG